MRRHALSVLYGLLALILLAYTMLVCWLILAFYALWLRLSAF